MTAAADVLTWGRERARAGPWRGDGRIAYLAPLPQGPPPSVEFLRLCLDTLAARGYASVLTSALAPAESQAFFAVGFVEQERLRLLSHDLRRLPEAPAAALRKGREADWPQVLEVDASAFDRFWRLDRDGLDEALAATPLNRFRVAAGRSAKAGRRGPNAESSVVGYAVSGRAGDEGYLQRLAVVPSQRRAGLGTALVVDGLRWMRRWKVRRAVVNTQLGNEAALALYLRLGFVPEPSDLAVLHADLSR